MVSEVKNQGPMSAGQPADELKDTGPKNLIGRIINFIAPRLFATMQFVANRDLNQVLIVDMGTGDSGARLMKYNPETKTWDVDLIVGTKGKIEESDAEGKLDKATPGAGEALFIERMRMQFKNVKICVDATAWARVSKDHKNYDKNQARINRVMEVINKHANLSFTLVSQREEGLRTQFALKVQLKKDPEFLGGLKIEDCEGVDGGKGSNQGIFVQAKEFGGNEIIALLKDSTKSLDDVKKFCRDAYTRDIPSAGKGEHKALFLHGSHLFMLKNKVVEAHLKGLQNADGTKKYDMDSDLWKKGLAPIDAQDLVAAGKASMASGFADCQKNAAEIPGLEAKIEAIKSSPDFSALTKEKQNDALKGPQEELKKRENVVNDFQGVVNTTSVIETYMDKRGTTVVRLGEYSKAKLTHAVGAGWARIEEMNSRTSKILRYVAQVFGA